MRICLPCYIALLVWVFMGCSRKITPQPAAQQSKAAASTAPQITFDAVGPRMISNQTAYPIYLYGNGFKPGATLHIDATPPIALKTHFIDPRHLTARVPEGIKTKADATVRKFKVTLSWPDGTQIDGKERLSIVNDLTFPDPYDMEVSPDGARIFVASPTTDTVWVVSRHDATPAKALQIGDGPRALRRFVDKTGKAWLVIANQFASNVQLLAMENPQLTPVSIPIGGYAQGLAVVGSRAYVTSNVTDKLHVVDLEAKAMVSAIEVGINPRPVAVTRAGLAVVGNHGSSDISLVALPQQTQHRIRPVRGMPIIGGHTEPFSKYIMGGKLPRDVVVNQAGTHAFVSSVGPNIGPNPQRMEVSHNGGVSVIDLKKRKFVRHVSMLRGTPEQLVIDSVGQRLYAADISTGRVVAFDVNKLIKSDDAARSAIIGDFKLTPPSGTELMRPKPDFEINPLRPGIELHSGPKALRLTDGGQTLLVLNRFTATIAELAVGKVAKDGIKLVRTHQLGRKMAQPQRHLGQVVYFTDAAHTRMSCDGCHPEGHVDGVLFTKGEPMQIYRSHSIRGARDSVPLFTPTRLPSIYATAVSVLARNRFYRLKPTHKETTALNTYANYFPPLPNPYFNADGSLPDQIDMPDATQGSPRRGMKLFEGRAGCGTSRCHPAPHFTADQDPETRGQLMDVGTPAAIGLRPQMQDLKNTKWPPPTLVGDWDNFPLLNTGAAGLSVGADGALVATHRFALRHVFELPAERGKKHSDFDLLSAAEQKDLLAYLLTL